MKLEDLVDIEQLTESMTPPDRNTFQIWSSTAFEVSPKSYREIAQIRDIYLEIPESQLIPLRVVAFIEALVDIMPSDEDRKRLIRAEAFEFRRFERPS